MTILEILRQCVALTCVSSQLLIRPTDWTSMQINYILKISNTYFKLIGWVLYVAIDINSLTHSLTELLTDSLTDSPTYSLTDSLPDSLTDSAKNVLSNIWQGALNP